MGRGHVGGSCKRGAEEVVETEPWGMGRMGRTCCLYNVGKMGWEWGHGAVRDGGSQSCSGGETWWEWGLQGKGGGSDLVNSAPLRAARSRLSPLTAPAVSLCPAPATWGDTGGGQSSRGTGCADTEREPRPGEKGQQRGGFRPWGQTLNPRGPDSGSGGHSPKSQGPACRATSSPSTPLGVTPVGWEELPQHPLRGQNGGNGGRVERELPSSVESYSHHPATGVEISAEPGLLQGRDTL